MPGAVQEAAAFLHAHPETQARFDRVVRLVEGFETPYGLELLAAVHWVVVQEKAASREEIARAVYGWGPGKKRFTAAQSELAEEHLRSGSWLEPFAGSGGRHPGFTASRGVRGKTATPVPSR